jgi:proton-dependent oligopeptide transporter, POT family
MTAMFVLRIGVVWTALDTSLPHRGELIIAILVLMAPFMAMVQTFFQTANRRFTTKRSRGAGFDMWYLFMNVGAAGGGWIIDVLRLVLHVHIAHMFTYGAFAALASIVVTMLMIRNEKQLVGPDEGPEEAGAKVERLNPFQGFMRVVVSATFWRFAILITLLLGVRAVFLYAAVIYPKYWLRVIGPDAAVGTLQAINPVLIVIGIILLLPLQRKFDVFSMLVFGAIISSFSLLVMVYPSYGEKTFWVSAASLTVLSLGELIWSPRLSEYTASIAPKGQEGVYLGLSMMPWFAAKTVVSAMSGYLLTWYCPELPNGELVRDRLASGAISFWNSPSAMWFWLFIPALAGPLLALAFRRFFTSMSDKPAVPAASAA